MPTSPAQDQLAAELDNWLAQMPGAVDEQVEAARQRIGRLSRQFDRVLADVAQRQHISVGDLEALSVLRRSASSGPLTPGRIAAELGVTSGTVSVRIERLISSGLVEHVDAPDGRSRPVRLTDRGVRRWGEATKARTDAEARVFGDALAPQDLVELNRLLGRLLGRFEREYGPAPRHDMTRGGGRRPDSPRP